MAKRGEGIPTYKASEEKRRHLSRAEREQRINRIVVAASSALIVVIVALLFVGILYEVAIKPSEPVAALGDVRITTTDFQKRVRQARVDTIVYLNNIAAQFGLTCETADSQSPIYAECQKLQYPTVLGSAVLDEMIDEMTIRQEAQERGITVSDEDVQAKINEQFGFNADAEPPTPAPEPMATATRRYTPTPTTTPTATLTPTGTVTPEGTPTATGTPAATSTPVPTLTFEERQEQFEESYELRVALARTLAGMSEEEYRATYENLALRDKVKEAITANIPAVVDQVYLRQIQVQTEQEAVEILEALRDGESFAALARNADAAREASDPNRYQGGELGWVPRDSLGFNVAEAAFGAEIGEVLGPIKDINLQAMQQGQTSEYYYVIQVLDHAVRELDEATFQQQRDQTFSTWLTGQRGSADRFDYWSDRVPEDPTEEQVFTEVQKLLPTPTSTPEGELTPESEE